LKAAIRIQQGSEDQAMAEVVEVIGGSCKTCVFAKLFVADARAMSLRCMRFPPQFVGMRPTNDGGVIREFMQPPVGENSSCGEFKLKL
jgi:hypothetical protein